MADNIESITIGNATSLVSGTLNVDYTTGTLLPGSALILDVGGTVTPLLNLAISTTPTGTATTVTGANVGGTGVTLQYQGILPSTVTATTSVAGLIGTSTTIAATSAVVCFTTGTLISTARGDVAVEDLEVGDLASTASGDLRPIRWIGRREMRPAEHPEPWNVHPVRISAGAFGAGLPTRPLRLSPGHPVLVGADAAGRGGYLVPIMCLINGTTIAREQVDHVTYWHVETEQHDILLAEGLPAESFLDYGNREWFGADAEAHALANPDFVAPGLGGRCRPVVVEGPLVEVERTRLDAVFATSLEAMCAWSAEPETAWSLS